MIETAVLKIFTICCARPALTLVLYLLLAFGAVLYTYENFAIDTDTSQLISSRLPWRQRELQLDAAFPQQADTLLVVVDGASPELAGSGAKKLAAALANDHEHIKTVREIGGGAFFEHNGLLFLSTERGPAHHRAAYSLSAVSRHARRRSHAARSRSSARLYSEGRGGG